MLCEECKGSGYNYDDEENPTVECGICNGTGDVAISLNKIKEHKENL